MPKKKPVLVVKRDIYVNGDLWFRKGDEIKTFGRVEKIGYKVPHPVAKKDPCPDQQAILFDHEVKAA